MAARRKRNELTLKKKYELVKEAEKNRTLKARELAELYGCGKTQVYNILKNKAAIIESYECNGANDIRRSLKQCRKSPYVQINDLLYEWFLVAVRKNIYPDGPTLCEKAQEIAKRLDVDDFKVSNGWLHKWKARHNVKMMTVSGESGEVSADSWKERLPEILEGYKPEDVWNMDESGCFWKALPGKGMAEKGKACHGGKTSKVRLTVALFCNASGEKEPPVVVWKSASPRCFKSINKSHLPVQYFDQKKAWMTGEIMHKLLSKLNGRLHRESRSIILFMDNAGCHPEDMTSKYSNIKVIFLPPNTTSVLQPLDLGIIKNFKVYYRKLLLHHILTKIEEWDSANEVVKSVTILNAIRWVSAAWGKVTPDTIKKCFRKAGILNKDFQVVTRDCERDSEEDPFMDLDVTSNMEDLESLMSQVTTGDSSCSVEEFINVDSELPVCQDIYDDKWDQEFLNHITQESSTEETEVIESEDSEDEGEEDPVPAHAPQLKSFKEAMRYLEEVSHFLDSKGHADVANETCKLMDSVAVLHHSSLLSARQSTLKDYFIDGP